MKENYRDLSWFKAVTWFHLIKSNQKEIAIRCDSHWLGMAWLHTRRRKGGGGRKLKKIFKKKIYNKTEN